MKFEKQIVLAKKLIQNTEDGKLSWEESPLGNTFQVSLPQYTVQIAKEGSYAFLVIRNERGEVIEKIRSQELSKEWPQAIVFLDELYVKVRRKALGVDKALDDIINNL